MESPGTQQNPSECREQCAPEAEAPKPRAAVLARRHMMHPPKRQGYTLEIAAAVLVTVYTIIAILGTRANTRIAEAWARAFCLGEGALFPRQFALCGAGDATLTGARSPLLKETSSLFKFYASGRRHCEGCTCTLQLKNRPDLMGWLLHLFSPMEDLLEVEVYMNEANMPPMVLAVGTPRQAKQLQSRSDVRSYAKQLKPGSGPNEPVPNWNGRLLQVFAEHGSLFTDIFSDPKVHSVLCGPQHADKLRLFRSALITSDNSEGSHKRLLRLTFVLPPADDMKALAPLLGLVPALIDLVGIYKLSPELKKRALEARAREAAASAEAEDERKRRIEALQKRKVDKLVEEKERIARLPPDARRKAEEKLAKQVSKKSSKVKMVRM